MKVGDKVWVQATVLELSQNSVLVRGYADKSWWMRDIDCKPVEPEAEEQKETDLDYRDATPEDVMRVMRGEKVVARFKSVDNDWPSASPRKGFLAGWSSYDKLFQYIDDTGDCFRFCQVYDPKPPEAESDDDSFYEPWEINVPEPTQYDPPISGLELMLDRDTVEPGDMFQSTRDGKFHRCNFTVGMTVEDAVFRGEQQRETWTFYRPKKVQA